MSSSSSRDIYVDADACPVIEEIVGRTRESGHSVYLVHSPHHDISVDREHVEVCETGDRSDAADHYIFNHVSSGDLVVTDDLGLAALVLNRDAQVLRFRGDSPTQDDIEMRLAMRDASRRERKRTGQVSGPSEYDREDRKRFCRKLESMLGGNPT